MATRDVPEPRSDVDRQAASGSFGAGPRTTVGR